MHPSDYIGLSLHGQTTVAVDVAPRRYAVHNLSLIHILRGSVKPADKPFALFYKGDISLLSKDNLNIAVIGVLNPDEKIELTESCLLYTSLLLNLFSVTVKPMRTWLSDYAAKVESFCPRYR